jgi:type VI secretion system secreted protein VgrG
MVTTLMSRTAMFASPLGEKLAFFSMSGREAMSRPFIYEVDLLSDDDSLDLLALLGQTVTIGVERTDGSVREFNGYVTHFSLVGEHGNYVRYRAVVRPWLWFLGQNQTSRVFQPETVPNLVQELFRERGFSDFEAEASVKSGSYRKWDYLMQYRESDLNFVSRLLEQEGIHYFFRHEKGKHILVLASANTAHKASPGYERVPYFPPLERERRQEEHVSSWITSRQIRPGTMSAGDFNFKQPAIVTSSTSAPLKTAQANAEIYDYPGEFEEGADADAQVKIRLEEHQVEHELVEGGGPVRGLGAGSRFSLAQFPRDDQNKEYIVLQASYEIRVSEFESNDVEDVESNFDFRFTAIDAKRPYRPARLTKKPVVEGPQTAIVVGEENQEISTDEYGRVKVQFHWDREGEYDENSSCWVRVSQVWAGMQWGAIHLPRVGQEVIVEFLEGDPDRPIVTGRVYNQDQMPPYTLPKNRTQSGIKSRSTPDGAPDNFNEIRFEDKKGQEELYLQAEKNMTTLVKNDQTTTVQKNRSASVGGSDSVSVTGDRSLSVHGNLSVSVDGAGKSAVHSTMNVTGKHTLDATDTIEIQAPTHIKLTVGGSSILITPSEITITAGGKASVTLNTSAIAKSSDGSTMTLDTDAKTEASTGASLALTSDVLAKSKMSAQLQLDTNALVKANADVTLDGMNVTAQGKMQATVQVGGSSVQCSQVGTQVGGPMVNVNGTGMVSIGGPMIKIG